MSTIAQLTPYATDSGADLTSLLGGGTAAVSMVNNRPVLVCPDNDTNVGGVWTLIAPASLTVPYQVVVSYMMQSAVAGNVRLGAMIEAITDGYTTDLDTVNSFDAANTVIDAVPTTAGVLAQVAIPLTYYDMVAAGDYVRIIVWRVGADTTNDTATGALYMLGAELRDNNPVVSGLNADTLGGLAPSAFARQGQSVTLGTVTGTAGYIDGTPNIAFSSAGWKKVGYWSGLGRRGHARVSIINGGGARGPFVLTIDAVTTASESVGQGSLFCYGGYSAITGVRITTDGTYKYLEFYTPYTSSFLDSIIYRREFGGWVQYPFTLYTSEVNSPGTDTVILEVTMGAALGCISASGNLFVSDGAGSLLDADLLDGQEGSYYLPAASYTAADVKTKLLTQDGAGSTIDADLLDGVQGSGYVLTSAYDAADVLAKMVTVDGTGSALDADTVDGVHYGAPTAFTPTIAFGGASVGVAYTTRVGRYIKIGKMVYFAVNILLSSKGTSVGALAITGLPFASNSTASFHQRVLTICDVAAAEMNIFGNIAPNSSKVDFAKVIFSTGALASITDTDVSATHIIRATGCYESAT